MPNTNQLFETIQSNIKVDRTLVVLAKKYLLQIPYRIINIPQEENDFLTQHGYSQPGTINVNDSVFDENDVDKVASYISYSIAFSEAVLELIHSNYFIVHSQHPHQQNFNIEWTTVVGGGGGSTSRWMFSHFATPIPSAVKKPLSLDPQRFILFDPDIYISELNISNAHSEVIDALKDTIDCFKKELYSPSLTMLGKVAEGAWIEVGISLASMAIRAEIDKEKNEKFIEELQGLESFAKKVEKIVTLYSSHHKDWFSELRRNSGIQIVQLQEIKVWTDVVRESRNAIHFGAVTTTENTFEKTAIILLAASKHLQTLYKFKEVADNL